MGLAIPRRGGLLRSNLGRLAAPLRRGGEKQLPVPPGTDAGWHSGFSTSSLTHQIREYIETYGGDTGVTWIYACVTLVMEEMTLYQYDFLDDRKQMVPLRRVPEDLRNLVEQPNQFMTYADFSAYREMDLELVGNSWWLMDQRNALGQPNALQRLRPEYTRPALNARGVLVGWVYSLPKAGVDIPYDLDEIIHFKLPSPHHDYLGMGRVQGIAKDAGTQIAIDDHVVGFFAQGARISGVLTVSGALSDQQFERLKRQFREEYGSANNLFSVLIAEQGLDYKPVTAPPKDAQVTELQRMEKDAILTGFRIHEDSLGGVSEGNEDRMNETSKALTRRMRAPADRASRRITLDLTALWRLGFKIDPESVRTKAEKFAMAGDALKAGSSVNEARIMSDQPIWSRDNFPELDISEEEEKMAWTPILPSGYDPFFVVQQAPGQGPNMGDSPGPTGAITPPRQNPEQPTQPVEDDTDRQRPDRDEPGETRRELTARSKNLLLLPSGRVLAIPDGYEQLDELVAKEADQETAERLVELQMEIYSEETPQFERDMVSFFNAQRQRTVAELGARYADGHTAKRTGKQDKKEIAPERVWLDDRENALLEQLFRARGTGISQRTARAIAELFEIPIADVRAILDDVASKVTGVNGTTKEKITKEILLGIQRGYSVSQIANGVPAENYRGIAGVFDEAVETRATLIARTETTWFYNLAALAAYEQMGASRVEVFDGTYDEACRSANGKVWTIVYARRHPMEHPNCVRSFAPILAETGRG